MDLVNGHILIPHRANWATLPEWQRVWLTEITPGITGPESRSAPRAHPLVSLSWLVTPRDLQEQARLDDRLRAAQKAGLACAPCWGRGVPLAADALNDQVELEPNPWAWRAGDYLFFADADWNYEVGQIEAVTGATLTLVAPLSRLYPAGRLVWPVLFGKLAAEELAALTAGRGEVKLTLQELVSPASLPIGALPPAGEGIGTMIVGTDFEVT